MNACKPIELKTKLVGKFFAAWSWLANFW